METGTWKDLVSMLEQAWQETSRRDGSFADAPCEPGTDVHETMAPVAPLEQTAHHAVLNWVKGAPFPPMPPAANRYAQVQLYGALGFARALADLPDPRLPGGWTTSQALRWLLCEVHADTVQPALDTMRNDLLGGKE